MRLSGVFDTIFAIFKRNVANHLHRRVREASKNGFSTFVWVQCQLEWESGRELATRAHKIGLDLGVL